MMRMLLGALFIVHGVAHFVGFVVPWKLISATDVPYRTTILAGRIDLGDAGIRAVGIVWLMLGLACIGIGTAWLTGRSFPPGAILVSLVSLVFCVIGWPDAKIGVVVNLLLLVALVAGQRFEWIR
jgi:uncharacterized membrane protein YphA (DoxX/SURF4 family)